MTDEQIRVKVAELCGWQQFLNEEKIIFGGDGPDILWTKPVFGRNATIADIGKPPNYPEDLNAMHEAEKIIPEELNEKYETELLSRCAFTWFATARQRALAFIATMEGR